MRYRCLSKKKKLIELIVLIVRTMIYLKLTKYYIIIIIYLNDLSIGI